MLSCQGLLWFLQNPTSHSSPLIPARGRYFVEMMPGSLPDSVFSSGRDVESSGDGTATAGTRSLVSLCRGAGNSNAWTMLYQRRCSEECG